MQQQIWQGNPKRMIENFFINGFVHGQFDIDVINMFDTDEFINCNSDEADYKSINDESRAKLNMLHQHIAKTYIEKLFENYKIGKNSMWSGVDSGSEVWHNDFIDSDRFTSNFLIYLDDNASHGNSIEVKNVFEEFKIIPKQNEFVWINQNKKFAHRATHKSGPRRLLSFEFFIPELV